MSAITRAIYERLAGDGTLTAMLATYEGGPGIFTTDPPPGNATLPYVVAAGEVSQAPFDTKTGLGREVRRDVRCYTKAEGSASEVEAIAERIRALLHRHALAIDGYETWVAECTGPTSVDEAEACGRIVSVRLLIVETMEGS